MFNIPICLALAATVFSLFAGLIFFWRGGESAGQKRNQLMRLRLFFQGIVLLILSIALFFHHK